MSLFAPLPPAGSVIDERLLINAKLVGTVESPAWIATTGATAMKLGVRANEYAREASLDKGVSTGRPAVVVHVDGKGEVVPPSRFDLTDLTEMAKERVKRAQRQTKYITRTNEVTAEAAEQVLAVGGWSNGDPLDPDHADALRGWAPRLRHCSRYVELWSCSCCGTTRTKSNCCGAAPCSREQRRRSRRWVERGMHLYDLLPNTKKVRWRLLTLSLRKTGNLAHDVDATIDMRRGLMRFLREGYGMTAGFGAIEQGEDANVHLHALVFCEYVDRARLQTWLRRRDCTVPGCRHPADDRCDACRNARTSCPHPDGTRMRCNGSWVVNVQAIRGRSGVFEAMKYAAAPVALHDLPEVGIPASKTQLAFAERLLRFYLVMRDRHRVESYGVAKTEIPDPDDDDLPLDGEMKPCPNGNDLRFVAFGVNQIGAYVWFRTLFGAA